MFDVEGNRHTGQGGEDDDGEDNEGEAEEATAGERVAAPAVGAVFPQGMRETTVLALGHEKDLYHFGPAGQLSGQWAALDSAGEESEKLLLHL